jgi:hypothetical protein
MPNVTERSDSVSPTVAAAVLLAAVPLLAEWRLAHPSVAEILAATGVSRSRAYELRARLQELLLGLVQATGRPARPEPAPPSAAVVTAVDVPASLLAYVYAHPGCVSGGEDHRRYSDGFRLHILELLQLHQDVMLEVLAGLFRLPLGTLKDWLRGGREAVEPAPDAEPVAPVTVPAARGPQLETVLDEWSRWHGDFSSFCHHLQLDCRIPFGKAVLAEILELEGARRRRRRPGRSPDEQALRDSFETFFSHAQWVGDGAQLPVVVNDQLYVFNLELHLDTFSAAAVGADISLVEDGAAVINALRDAIESTGKRPLSLLLDNKPSNHTDNVKAELDDTILTRATPFRPQNKAHVEGCFGLLKPTLEGLELQGTTPIELAESFAKNLVTVWARIMNHRPRKDRQGQSRAELLETQPSAEEIQLAREALQERQARQEKARQTLAARQDPVVRQIITQALARLGLDDPDGHFLTALARYPLNAVIEALAIFEGKQRAATLPEGVDARYLLGIARNIAQDREIIAIASALWQARVDAGDLIARRLQAQHDLLVPRDADVRQALDLVVDAALATNSRFERLFWLDAAARTISREDQPNQQELFLHTTRRIANIHAAQPRTRNEAVRILAAKLRPLD